MHFCNTFRGDIMMHTGWHRVLYTPYRRFVCSFVMGFALYFVSLALHVVRICSVASCNSARILKNVYVPANASTLPEPAGRRPPRSLPSCVGLRRSCGTLFLHGEVETSAPPVPQLCEVRVSTAPVNVSVRFNEACSRWLLTRPVAVNC